VQRAAPTHQFWNLAALLFIQSAAMGAWFVPLGTVLDAHGLGVIKAYAFATSAIAAFISPLLFAAMADRHASPVIVLRGLTIATALTMTLSTVGIAQRWNPWLVLACIQFQALFYTPTWSMAATVAFSQLTDPKHQFGPLRATATLGWMFGAVLISVIGADQSSLGGFTSVVLWLLTTAATWLLPAVEPPKSEETLTLRQRLGLDALQLLKIRDHRVVFITAAIFSIPMAAFYPFSPVHLQELGFARSSAWMTLGQVTEIVTLLALGGALVRFRLKWVFAAGIATLALRYGLCGMNTPASLLIGITLHGLAFTLFFITAQIYLEERIERAWRARGQALLSLITGGVGNLAGYLGTGLWFNWCHRDGPMRWTQFWGGLAIATAAVLAYFILSYRGRVTPPSKSDSSESHWEKGRGIDQFEA
jgi:MFS family permease